MEEETSSIQGTSLQNGQEDDYKIYEYLKKNPGLFAGLGTVFIAAFSALISFCSYICESASLKYWGIDPVYVSLSTASRVYGTIASLIFIFVYVMLFLEFDVLAEKSAGIRKKVVYLKKLNEEYRKEVNKARHGKKRLWNLRICKSSASEDHANQARSAIEQLKSNVKSAKKEMNKQIIARLFLLYIVFFPSMCILFCVELAHYQGMAILPVIAAAIGSFVLIITQYAVSKNTFTDKKGARKEAVCEYAALKIQTDVPKALFPSKKILSGDYKIKQTDQKIKRCLPLCLLFVALVIATLLIVFYFLGYNEAKDRTQFMITSQSGMEYAVLYNNGNHVVIARCSESGQTLTIDTSSQKVISVEGIAYDIRQYEEVKIDSIPDETKEASDSADKIER